MSNFGIINVRYHSQWVWIIPDWVRGKNDAGISYCQSMSIFCQLHVNIYFMSIHINLCQFHVISSHLLVSHMKTCQLCQFMSFYVNFLTFKLTTYFLCQSYQFMPIYVNLTKTRIWIFNANKIHNPNKFFLVEVWEIRYPLV